LIALVANYALKYSCNTSTKNTFLNRTNHLREYFLRNSLEKLSGKKNLECPLRKMSKKG
jgi:hypothetical protein